MSKVVIIDYGMGNLRSVYNAFKSLGASVSVSDSPGSLKKADKLVLPGVGAFKDTIDGLRERGLAEAILRFISSGRIYLGICLGLQILFDKSDEGAARGFGILKGQVRRFKKNPGLKIPHMGWNSVIAEKEYRLLGGIDSGAYFYFVHSYYAEPEDAVVAARTEYGGSSFASMIARDNIYATQFHPEKSQSAGLRFLKNFMEL